MTEKEKLLYIKETMENIAHQWRQPLSQINATVGAIDRILYEKKIEEPLLEEKLQEIENLTKYMSNTIEDFKSQLVHDSKKEGVNLVEIVDKALLHTQMTMQENEIEMSVKVDGEYKEYDYFGYSNQLFEILIVLLNNSKDALLDRNTFESKIEVTLTYDKNQFTLRVSDNAGGISKSVMKKIFEPSYTTKHKSQGTGIGLFMAKKILQEQSGSLSVKNVGEGTEFCVNLSKVTK